MDGAPHLGTALLRLQGEDLDASQRSGDIDVVRLALVNDMLSRFTTSMGAAERIKNTVFPTAYRAYLHLFIYVFIFALALSLADLHGYREVLVITTISLPFSDKTNASNERAFLGKWSHG